LNEDNLPEKGFKMELPVLVGKGMHKRVLGIRIAYAGNFSSFQEMTRSIKEGEMHQNVLFELKTGNFQEGDNKMEAQFISTPAIRKIILERNIPLESLIGYFHILIDPTNQNIVTSMIFPDQAGFFKKKRDGFFC
jgi:hypothetical protein